MKWIQTWLQRAIATVIACLSLASSFTSTVSTAEMIIFESADMQSSIFIDADANGKISEEELNLYSKLSTGVLKNEIEISTSGRRNTISAQDAKYYAMGKPENFAVENNSSTSTSVRTVNNSFVSENGMYTVKQGDTLSGIAEFFNVSEDYLCRINGISDPNKIFVGQKIYLYEVSMVTTTNVCVETNTTTVADTVSVIETTTTSTTMESVATDVKPGRYIVKYGDTISDLATYWGTTVRSICLASEIENSNNLMIGQELVNPTCFKSFEPNGNYYRMVMSEPSYESEFLYCLGKMDIFVIVEEIGSWWKIENVYGDEGYVWFEGTSDFMPTSEQNIRRIVHRPEGCRTLVPKTTATFVTTTTTTVETTSELETTATTIETASEPETTEATVETTSEPETTEAAVETTSEPETTEATVETTSKPDTTTTNITTTVPVATDVKPGRYIVEYGDSISYLAENWGTTVDFVCRVNEIENPNEIMVGQELVVPTYFKTFCPDFEGGSWCVWSKKSFESEIIDYLDEGEVFAVIEDELGFWKIMTESGIIGYASLEERNVVQSSEYEIKRFIYKNC